MTQDRAQPLLIVVMGVSGSGKSTVGRLLAQRLNVPFAEGDDFHPPANIAKMTAGRQLDDLDRMPWLDAIAAWLDRHAGSGGVVSCSALRHRYRDRLRTAAPGLFFVHLAGPPELIAARFATRIGHFMSPGLLGDQFATLEPLGARESGAVVPVDGSPEQTTARAYAALPH